MLMCIVTDTTGFPKGRYSDPRDTAAFDTARVVGLSWVLCDEKGDILKEETHVIKPEGFEISEGATKVHGITNELALTNGKDWKDVIRVWEEDWKGVTGVLGHNVRFIVNVLASELYRRGQTDLANNLRTCPSHCTMKLGEPITKLVRQNDKGTYTKFPSLEELCEKLFETTLPARIDLEKVRGCVKCYFKIKSM
jgi:DNA polymerase-3 subunit alpha